MAGKDRPQKEREPENKDYHRRKRELVEELEDEDLEWEYEDEDTE